MYMQNLFGEIIEVRLVWEQKFLSCIVSEMGTTLMDPAPGHERERVGRNADRNHSKRKRKQICQSFDAGFSNRTVLGLSKESGI